MPAPSPAFVLILSMVAVGGAREDSRHGHVSGVVIGPDGRAASKAELIAAGGGRDGEPSSILGRAVADEQGRFTIDLEPGTLDHDRPTLWAFRAGSAATSSPIDRASMAGLPIRLALGSPSRWAFRVASPEGRPVPGARILPRRLANDDQPIPEALAEQAGATTDGEGRAILDAFRSEDLAAVRVEAAGFGIQVRDFRGIHGPLEAGPRGISLLPPARVSGRVVADDPSAASGLKVRLTTSLGSRESAAVGIAEATTDAAGRFEVKEIAAGSVEVRVVPRAGSHDLPARVARRKLAAGTSAEVEVPLRRGVRVTGLARDALDGGPVAGVLVAVYPSGADEPSKAWTDAEGRYETFIPAGLATHRVARVPDPYLAPPDFLGPRPVEVPPAIARFELPPIVLTRGADLRGSVVDDRGGPVAGARVEATWTLFDGRVRAPRSANTRSNPDGTFLLGPADPNAQLSLTALYGPAATEKPITARASDHRPMTLTVVGVDASSPAGRILDAEGRPVAGAEVRIREVSGDSDRSTVTFEGGDRLTTDAQGRFQGPRVLRRGRAYRAVAEAKGFREGRTRAVRLDSPGVLTFPEIVLAREPRGLAVEGRVLDRQGRPIVGAVVRTPREGPCPRRAVSGADGRFRLDDLPEGRDFLFAQAEGFRFVGRVIDPAAGPFDLTLTRLDEAPDGSMRTRTLATPPAAMTLGFLAAYVERVVSQGDQATRVRALEGLARVAPGRVLALLEARGAEDAWLADHLRLAAAGSLVGLNRVDDALAAIAAIRDGRWRVRAELEAADSLPGSLRARKREWVERALVDARTIRDPSGRAIALAGVAARLVDLGESDRAARLLDEAKPIAESLPLAGSGGRARAAFAEALAKVDPPGALALTKDLIDPGLFDRSRLRIARSLAGRDPARALQVLGTLRDPRSLCEGLPGLCHAMARVDPDRARRMIGQARPDDPCVSAYALGMMALAIADLDKPGATARLREAFDLLADRADSASNPDHAALDPAVIAATLLPVVERVDPALVPEHFWRAVSLHAPSPPAESRSDALLAMLLARYDRATGLALLEPLATWASTSPIADLEPLVAAAAVVDPALAVRLVEQLPDAPDLAFHHPKNGARLALSAALARPAPACWDDAVARFLHLWSPTSPDED